MISVKIYMYKTRIGVDNKPTRRNMIFIRTRTKLSSSFTKATTQFNHHILPPIIKMRQLSHNFLKSISTNILETIYWSEDESVHDPVISKKLSSNYSKSSSTSPDNPPILQSIYTILDSHNINININININTSDLESKPLDIKLLNNLLSKVSCVLIDNNFHMI